MSPDIEIIGDGCAALSLAARASELNHNIRLIKPTNAPTTNDHVWGFWSDPILAAAQQLARATWQKWAIITPNDCAVLDYSSKSCRIMPLSAVIGASIAKVLLNYQK